MRLVVGDNIYLKPDRARSMFHFGLDSELVANQKYKKISNKPFTVNQVRQRSLTGRYGGKREEDEICIIWIDGSDWWWDQIGGDQPWTRIFISEKEYIRNKKLIELGIED